jgi:hypothetical protein
VAGAPCRSTSLHLLSSLGQQYLGVPEFQHMLHIYSRTPQVPANNPQPPTHTLPSERTAGASHVQRLQGGGISALGRGQFLAGGLPISSSSPTNWHPDLLSNCQVSVRQNHITGCRTETGHGLKHGTILDSDHAILWFPPSSDPVLGKSWRTPLLRPLVIQRRATGAGKASSGPH